MSLSTNQIQTGIPVDDQHNFQKYIRMPDNEQGKEFVEASNTKASKRKNKFIIMAAIGVSLLVIIIIVILLMQLKSNKDEQNENDTFNKYQADGFTKPSNDKKLYEIFQLENGINVLLVKTPENYDVGMSLVIKGLGGYSDPSENPGTAHFLEHMVFTGSENYQVNEYVQYISQRKGVPNGITSYNWTAYPTTMPKQGMLEDVMRRIQDYLTNPTLNESRAIKEIYAVTSEYKNMLADAFQFSRSIEFFADPKHPLSKLMVGNYDTLINMTYNNCSSMRDYFERLYVPKNMYLLVQTHNSTANQTKQQITTIFNKIPKSRNDKYLIPDFLQNISIYNSSLKGSIIFLKQNSPITKLLIAYPFVNVKLNSVTLLSVLINAFANPCTYLTAQFYVYQCQIGQVPVSENEFLITVEMSLTEEGQRNVLTIQKYPDELIQGRLIAFLSQQDAQSVINQIQEQVKLQFNDQDETGSFEQIIQQALLFSLSQSKEFQFIPFDYKEISLNDFTTQIKEQIRVQNSIQFLRSSNFDLVYQNALNDSTLTEQEKQKRQQLQQFVKDQDYKNDKLWNLKFKVFENLFPTGQVTLQANENSFYQQQQNFDDKKNYNFQEIYQNSQFMKNFILPDLQTQIKELQVDLKQKQQNLYQQKLQKQLQQQLESNKKNEFLSLVQNKNLMLNENNIVLESQTSQLIVSNDFGNAYLIDKTQFFMPQHFVIRCLLEISNKLEGYTTQELNDIVAFKYYQKAMIDILVPGSTPEVTDLGLSFQLKCNDLSQCIQTIEKLKIIVNFLEEPQKVLDHLRKASIIKIAEKLETFPSQNIKEILLENLVASRISTSQIVNSLKTLNLTNFKNFDRVDLLFSGKIDKTGAQDIFDFLIKQFKISGKYLAPQKIQVIQLVNNTKLLTLRKFHDYFDSENSLIANVYQIGQLNAKDRKILQIFEDYFNGYSFNYLRGENMLGYAASVKAFEIKDLFHLVIFVQGYQLSASQMEIFIERNIEKMHDQFFKNIDNNTDFEYPFLKTPNDVSIAEVSNREWARIQRRDFARESFYGINITLKDLQEKFEIWFIKLKSRFSIQYENSNKLTKVSQNILSPPETVTNAFTDLFFERDDIMLKTQFYNPNLTPQNYQLNNKL